MNMSDDVYRKLAKVLDTLPNGFPAKENDAGIKLLEKIFTPDQAELFCDLRLQFETAEQIAERTGRPLEGLEEKLIGMRDKGQLWAINLGGTWVFKMVPWAFGIYEFQLPRLDKEFAELNEQFYPSWGKQFFENTPQLMQSLPIEEEIPVAQEALPYEKVSTIIENGQSFLLNQCICKKEQSLLEKPCDRPLEVCMAIAPVEGVFENSPIGRVITKDEAYKLLNECEENALVHLTGNTQKGHFFICNCCGCCCGVLRGINELGVPASTTIHSNYYAEIDQDECIDCGVCAEERCQVNAISASEDAAYHVFQEKCIGCGLCISACPTDAIKMVRKPEERLVTPPQDETEWFKQRGSRRGVDFSQYE
jgi:Pyruvate/2-oxoacid:ferredoxin oxidoreductase delta subunit